MAGWYELSKNAASGKYRFVLKAGNGEIILTSEQYESKSGATNGIESVQKNGSDDGRYKKETAKNGSAYFNLTAVNGQIIGTSQMYSSTSARDNGIASVKTNSPSTVIKEIT